MPYNIYIYSFKKVKAQTTKNSSQKISSPKKDQY